MTVSRETVPVNTNDDSDPKNLGQCDDIVSESNQLEHDANSNVSPVDIEGNEESVQNIREEHSMSENMTPQTPTSKKGELEHSSPKAVDCSTEVDSEGKIQLSQFEDTVDYNTGELSDDGDSSSSSSSGRSPDENDKDEPVNKKPKPDLSLRPSFITKRTENTPKPKQKAKPRRSYMRPKPQRVQPSRSKKSTVQYIPFSSDSDNDTSQDDSKDDDFVPEGQKGYLNLYHHI